MKNQKENRYFQMGINGLMVVIGGILFYYILFHSDKLMDLVHSIIKIMTPITAGFVMAYVLNPVMVFLERKVVYNLLSKFKKIDTTKPKIRKIIRLIVSILTIILFLMALYSLVIMIVPQIMQNIQNIIDRVPTYFLNVSDYYRSMLSTYPNIEKLLNQYWVDISNWFYTSVVPSLEKWISATSTTLLGSIISIFKSLINFILGIIISLYLLIDKEKFQAQSKKLLYAFFKESRANNFLNNLRYANKIFGGFITGKAIDSIIIGVICYFCMLILKLPYAALISVVVGVTNIIPYFGPFIGAIPSAFLVLLVNPKKCLIFLIFVFVLQQFDGNILGPKILGDSTGLSSFWVVFSITLFSGLLGIVGMFIGVPLFAVIYSAIRTFVNESLQRKNMPDDTSFYIQSDYNMDNTEIDGGSFRFAKDTFDNISSVASPSAGSSTTTKE